MQQTHRSATDFVPPLRNQRRVIHNFEQLTAAEKTYFPTALYHRVRETLGTEDDEDKPYRSVEASSVPYPTESDYYNLVYVQKTRRYLAELPSATSWRSDGEIHTHVETDQENYQGRRLQLIKKRKVKVARYKTVTALKNKNGISGPSGQQY